MIIRERRIEPPHPFGSRPQSDRSEERRPPRGAGAGPDRASLIFIQRTAGNAATEDLIRGRRAVAQRQTEAQPLRDRVLQQELTVVEDYEGFRLQAERWLSRWVMSDEPAMMPGGSIGPALYRERGLVAGSNLRDLHRRILASEGRGQTLRIRARLQAGRNRYEDLVFDVPGHEFLEVTTIEGDPVDRGRIKRELAVLRAARARQLRRARRQIIRAVDIAQQAVLEGSVRYRATESTARQSRYLEVIEQVGRVVDQPDPMEAGVDYRVRMAAIREMEAVAERELTTAREELQRLRELDARLGRHHEALGSEYQPESNAEIPNLRRAGRFDETRAWDPAERWPDEARR